MVDKFCGYVKLDDVLSLDETKPIGQILAEEYDQMIANDIIGVIKKYFPNTKIDEKRVIRLARMIVAEEKGGSECMARYIDLKELEKRIKENIKIETLEEKVFVEWCKDECIRQGYAMPTADVVPKSEVAYWQDAAANARREILLEIERLALSKIPEDVEVAMLKDTYYIEALDELMIKYGVTDKAVGCKKEEKE